MLVLLAILGCGDADTVEASNVMYGADDLTVVLARLEEACLTPSEPSAGSADPSAVDGVSLGGLDERLAALELKVAEYEAEGVVPARVVSYDPRLTTMDAKTAQDALTELHARVAVLEEALGQDMGEAHDLMYQKFLVVSPDGSKSITTSSGGLQPLDGPQGGQPGMQQGGQPGMQQGGQPGMQQGGQQGGQQGMQQGGQQGGQPGMQQGMQGGQQGGQPQGGGR